MRQYYLPILLFGLMLFGAAKPTVAAEITVANLFAVLPIQQDFEVNLYLNTEGEDINAVAGEVVYPRDILELKKISYGNSLVNFWVESPAERSLGKIDFSGIIPGGYYDTKGLLMTLIFSASADGAGSIDLQNLQALLNDGAGTATKITAAPANFVIDSQSPVNIPMVAEIIDHDPPEVFDLMITQIPDIAGDQYLLVFLTQDKGTGVAYYEIKEGVRDWQPAVSPYVLHNQRLDKKIQVRAFDNSGNFRYAYLTPPNYQPWYQNYEIFVIIILVIFIGCLIFILNKKTSPLPFGLSSTPRSLRLKESSRPKAGGIIKEAGKSKIKNK